MAISRIEFVVNRADVFAAFAMDTITLEELEAFANNAEEQAHAKSREMTAFLRGNERALITHAAHMRTVAGKIISLRGGLIPALKVDRNDLHLKSQAVLAMAWIKGEFDAMTCLIH